MPDESYDQILERIQRMSAAELLEHLDELGYKLDELLANLNKRNKELE